MKTVAALALLGAGTAWAQAPSFETRQQVLRTLVQVTASDCADGVSRSGSGFALETPGRIVTAHHVVGGCRSVQVSYEAVKPPAPKRREARVVRVLAAGDLSLLQIDAPPAVPTLRLAAGAPSRDQVFAGFGYALGMPTAGDQEVRFSTGATRLTDILPPAAAEELRHSGSPIAIDREVLRFNVALQPGMSGGPIVNAAGEVIGVVAGGLKAGAAPASWGWPGEGVRQLLASAEPTDRVVRVASTYYSLQDFTQVSRALAQNRRLRCGELEFTDMGLRPFGELARGADDMQRLLHVIGLSGDSIATLANEQFRVWVHTPSGATAVVPAGTELKTDGSLCVAASRDGQLRQIVWGAATPAIQDVQARSVDFENRLLAPRLPRFLLSQYDANLTTTVMNPMTGMAVPGPQVRGNPNDIDNLLVFNRAGLSMYARPPQFMGEQPPYGHLFRALAARSRHLLATATIYAHVDPMIASCRLQPAAMGCVGAHQHQRQWTRYVLATQLSTFPTY